MSFFNRISTEERARDEELDKKIDLDAGFILLTHTEYKTRPRGTRAVDPLLIIDIEEGKGGTWVTYKNRVACVEESAGEVMALVGRFKRRLREYRETTQEV